MSMGMSMDKDKTRTAGGAGPDEREIRISVRGLQVGYGSFVLMRNVEFDVRAGDVFFIMGGSGCGKSTLLRVLMGLKPPQAGLVLYGGTDFWGGGENVRRKIMRHAGVLFQGGALWSSMTLAENVGLPLQQYTDLDDEEIREQASLKLALAGLAGFEDYYPSEISGGMRKRAGLARALALDPQILFLDEPSAGLELPSAGRSDSGIAGHAGHHFCYRLPRTGQHFRHCQQQHFSGRADPFGHGQRQSQRAGARSPYREAGSALPDQRRRTPRRGLRP